MAANLSARRKSVEQIVFCVLALVVFVLAWKESRSYPDLVRWFPTGVLIAAMTLLGVKIALESYRLWRTTGTEDAALDNDSP